jgi:hypothetical protein
MQQQRASSSSSSEQQQQHASFSIYSPARAHKKCCTEPIC